jgi:ferritin-like metal-binding protein YciE
MEQGSFRQFYLRELRRACDCEAQMAKLIPEFIELSSDADLVHAFESHLEQTRDHVARIEMILRATGEMSEDCECRMLRSLLEEIESVKGQKLPKPVLDLALLAYAQAMEHVEIARYRTLRDYGSALGELDAVSQFQSTLEEEEEFVRRLDTIAQTLLAAGIRAGAQRGTKPAATSGGELEPAA